MVSANVGFCPVDLRVSQHRRRLDVPGGFCRCFLAELTAGGGVLLVMMMMTMMMMTVMMKLTTELTGHNEANDGDYHDDDAGDDCGDGMTRFW